MELYPHQYAGVSFLSERTRALLADEQGLGKTVTALVAAEGFDGRVLVVCPTVVLWNWEGEARTWLGFDTRVQVIEHGRAELEEDADVVVVTHGLLLRPFILEQLRRSGWDVCIVDEAHAFKSPAAKRTRALYRDLAPCCERVWILTGTPCPNNAAELWTHLRGLEPRRIAHDGRTLPFDAFRARFCHVADTPYGPKVTGNRADMLAELKKRLEGFILRRRKKDVLKDLPPIRFETIRLRPTKLPTELEELSRELTPALEAAIADAEDALDGFDVLKDRTDFARFRRLCGLAKIDPVAELLDAELEDEALDKVVVFAHHKDVVEGIARRLSKFGVYTITGSTPAAERREAVEEFQRDPRVRVIVANIVAGGVGVTLTASSEVLFAETSWVPGENAQAADRCHRIGQTERVRARFVSLAGTIDDAIAASLAQKARMIAEVLDG